MIDDRLRALRADGAEIVVGLDASDKPAGFAAIDPNFGYLDQLCVAPAERGSGLATALLNEAKRRAPGVVDLDVNEANARARRFYEREGVLDRRGAASARIRDCPPSRCAGAL